MTKHRFILPAALVLFGALAAPMAMAQTSGACDSSRQGACAQTQKTVTQKAANQKSANQKAAVTPNATASQKTAPKTTAAAPKVGDSAKSGQSFQRAKNSRVAAPDSAHEYRVVNSSLVLVNRKSLKIEKVLGPLSQFTQ